MTIKQLFFPFVLALLLHTVLLSLFMFSFDSTSKSTLVKSKPAPEIIQASVLDERDILAESKRLQQQQADKKIAEQEQKSNLRKQQKREERRLKELKKQRIAAEKKQQRIAKQQQQQLKQLKQQQLQQEKRIAEQKQKLAEQKKKIAQQKRLEAERTAKIKQQQREQAKKEEQERKRLAAEKEVQRRKLEAERAAAERLQREQERVLAEQKRIADERVEQEMQAKIKAEKNKRAMRSAQYAIQRKVNSNWVRPLSVKSGLKCSIRVRLMASGDVLKAIVVKSSGDPVFDRSAETAVRKAAPLPVPTDKELFAKQFRTFEFVFNPK